VEAVAKLLNRLPMPAQAGKSAKECTQKTQKTALSNSLDTALLIVNLEYQVKKSAISIANTTSQVGRRFYPAKYGDMANVKL
jgi:hypothetical protein